MTLFEVRDVLGGQVRWWAKAESRRELVGIVDWLADRLDEEAIDMRLSTRAGLDDLETFDAVVVATGSTGLKHGWTMLRPERWPGPPLPGAGLPHVISYTELLERDPYVGQRAVLFDTMGGRQGVVVAEYLVQRGCEVDFVTQLNQHSPELAASRDWGKVHAMLKKAGVRFHVDRELVDITSEGVTMRDLYTGDRETLLCVDSVIMVQGSRAEDALFHQLSAMSGPACHLIGDAMTPRRVSDAIREGELVARKI